MLKNLASLFAGRGGEQEICLSPLERETTNKME